MTISEEFAQKLQAKLNATVAAERAEGGLGIYERDYKITVEAGRVYDRIVQVCVDDAGHPESFGSVHAFVTKTGLLVKAAGWKAPQKTSTGGLAVRYNLSTPEGFAAAIEAADFAGGYLYDGRGAMSRTVLS